MQQGTLLKAHMGTSATEVVQRFTACASPQTPALSFPVFLTPTFSYHIQFDFS